MNASKAPPEAPTQAEDALQRLTALVRRGLEVEAAIDRAVDAQFFPEVDRLDLELDEIRAQLRAAVGWTEGTVEHDTRRNG